MKTFLFEVFDNKKGNLSLKLHVYFLTNFLQEMVENQ